MPTGERVPDADDDQLGVVLLGDADDLVPDVDPDRLVHLVVDARGGQPFVEVAQGLLGDELLVDEGVAPRRVDHDHAQLSGLRLLQADLQRGLAVLVGDVADHDGHAGDLLLRTSPTMYGATMMATMRT